MIAVVGPRVIVETESQTETLRPSGVITVEAEAPAVVGRIVACAQGWDVQVDDVVIFPPSAGQPLEHAGQTYLVLDADDICAVYEQEGRL